MSKHRAVKMPAGENAKWQARNGGIRAIAKSTRRKWVIESLRTTWGRCGRCGKQDYHCGLFVAALLAQPPLDVLVASHHRYVQRCPTYAVPGIDMCFYRTAAVTGNLL